MARRKKDGEKKKAEKADTGSKAATEAGADAKAGEASKPEPVEAAGAAGGDDAREDVAKAGAAQSAGAETGEGGRAAGASDVSAPAAEAEPTAETKPTTDTEPAVGTEPAAEKARAEPSEPGDEDEGRGGDKRAGAGAEADGGGGDAAAREAAEAGDEGAVEPRRAPIDVPADARYSATGKRKTSVARVVLRSGGGAFELNGRTLESYFPRATLQARVRQPLELTGYSDRIDVRARVHGGGVSGQADAVRHGIAKALMEVDPQLRSELKRRQQLTRDPRAKERRKAGLKKARKRPQFSKR